MGSPYHQFCPVAKAMELLDERWTLLVVREMLEGSEHFNDLRRGVPRMSPTLLSRRLQQLCRAGVVDRREAAGEVRYVLTPAGRELAPVVEALGTWGIRWIGELGDPDLDPQLLLWDMHRRVEAGDLPPGRTVVAFDFPTLPASRRRWWLVLRADEVDVCDTDPGYEVALTVRADLRALVDVWVGATSWDSACRSKRIALDGPTDLCRRFPSWFRLSAFAAIPRPT